MEENKQRNLFVPDIVTLPPTMDIEELQAVAQGWDARLKQLSRQRVEVEMRIFHTPHMQYAEENYSGSYLLEGVFPGGSVVICLIRSNEIISSRNKAVEENELIILFSGDELDVIFNGRHQVFVLTVEEKYFEEAFEHYFNQPPGTMLQGERLFMKADAAGRYMRHMHSWLDYFRQRDPKELSFREFLYIERQILSDLFASFRLEEEPCSGGRLIIPKARQMLHESLDNELSIAQIAHALGVSVRTLQHHFRRELGVTPKQYLQSLRLNAIHEELLQADPREVTVGELAFKYSYFHHGHFGSEYKRMFGETPSQTLRGGD